MWKRRKMFCKREFKQRKMGRKGFSKQRQVLGEMNKGYEIALGKLSNYLFDLNLSSSDSDEVIMSGNFIYITPT